MTGTGFWILGDGKLVTNLHVLRKGASVYVKSSSASRGTKTFDPADVGSPAKGILAYDKEWDLAVVQFDVSAKSFCKWGKRMNSKSASESL